MCEQARSQFFPLVEEPIEYHLLRGDSYPIHEVNDLFMHVIKETRHENHNLRLMMLQEISDKQTALKALQQLKAEQFQLLNQPKVEKEERKARITSSLAQREEEEDEMDALICETEDFIDDSLACFS